MAKIDELEERVNNLEAEVFNLQQKLAELAKERNLDNRILMDVIGRLVQNTSLVTLTNDTNYVKTIVNTAERVCKVIQEELTKQS